MNNLKKCFLNNSFFVFFEDLWLWTHANVEQPREGGPVEATDKLKE